MEDNKPIAEIAPGNLKLIASSVTRLDTYLTEMSGLTRSRISSLIKDGNVTVDGITVCKSGTKLKPGSEISLTIPSASEPNAKPQDIPLNIIYEDDDVAVVFKPSGMVVHPAAGNPDSTMVNALLFQLDGLSGIGGELRPGIVHRIDKDTSGLLLVAKNDASHVFLSQQIADHTVERRYLAIVQGKFKTDEGFVEGPIGRHPNDRKRMAIVQGGRPARTNWRVLEELKGATLIEARLTTGRTHQIRVHMSSIGHPVLGDPIYGPKKPPYPIKGGQLLHAAVIGFVHPATHEFMHFEAAPEQRFMEWLEKLRQ